MVLTEVDGASVPVVRAKHIDFDLSLVIEIGANDLNSG